MVEVRVKTQTESRRGRDFWWASIRLLVMVTYQWRNRWADLAFFLDGRASLAGAFVGSEGRGIPSVLMKVSQRAGGILRFLVDEDVRSVMAIPVLFDSHPPSDRPF